MLQYHVNYIRYCDSLKIISLFLNLSTSFRFNPKWEWEYFRVQLSNILLSSTNININSIDARIYFILSANSLRNQRNKGTI